MTQPVPSCSSHLAIDPDGEPQRADQVHLHGERVEQHGAFEVVVGARCPLQFGHQRRDVLDVRCGYRAAGVVDQDVDAAVGLDDLLDEGVDARGNRLGRRPSGRNARPTRVRPPLRAGVERGPRATDDRRPGAQQFVRDAHTDAATGARDDGDLAVQCAHAETITRVIILWQGRSAARHQVLTVAGGEESAGRRLGACVGRGASSGVDGRGRGGVCGTAAGCLCRPRRVIRC